MFERRIISFPTTGALFLAAAALLGCSSKPSAPAESPAAESPQPTTDSGAAFQRPKLTADECTAEGGTVVGDIGDGAIHRPDYRCPSGAEPSGSIESPGDAPVAVEGSVCCPE